MSHSEDMKRRWADPRYKARVGAAISRTMRTTMAKPGNRTALLTRLDAARSSPLRVEGIAKACGDTLRSAAKLVGRHPEMVALLSSLAKQYRLENPYIRGSDRATHLAYLGAQSRWVNTQPDISKLRGVLLSEVLRHGGDLGHNSGDGGAGG